MSDPLGTRTFFNDTTLLKISKAQDGDIVVIKGDNHAAGRMQALASFIQATTGKRLALVVLPEGGEISLLPRSELESMLKKLLGEHLR